MLILRIHTFPLTVPFPSGSFDCAAFRRSAQDDKRQREILRLASLAQDDNGKRAQRYAPDGVRYIGFADAIYLRGRYDISASLM